MCFGKYAVRLIKQSGKRYNWKIANDCERGCTEHSFAQSSILNMLNISKQTTCSPPLFADVRSDIVDFLILAGITDIIWKDEIEVNWFEASMAYYFNPFTVNISGTDVNFVNLGIIYDAPNDSNFIVLIDDDGMKYSLRAFADNEKSFISDGTFGWDLSQPEDEDILALPAICAWTIYPEEVEYSDVENIVRSFVKDSKIFSSAYNLGSEDEMNKLQYRNSELSNFDVVVEENGVNNFIFLPIQVSWDYEIEFTAESEIISCPLALDSVFNVQNTMEDATHVLQPISCNETEKIVEIKLQSLSPYTPSIILHFSPSTAETDAEWRLKIINPYAD